MSDLVDYSQDKIDLIKNTICKGATDDDLNLFLYTAKRLGLDPLARQIYSVGRWDKKAGKEIRSIQISVDGFRVIAERTGEYQGQTEPQWCGQDGIWKNVWTSELYPYAARIGVYRKGFQMPLYAVAKWDSYVQKFYDKNKNEWVVSPMWAKMPDLMISKVAECLALRKAFPADLSGVYSTEEMAQERDLEPQESEQLRAAIESKPKTEVLPPKKEVIVSAAYDSVINGIDKNVIKETLDNYKIPFGKWTGRHLRQFKVEDLNNYKQWILDAAKKDNKDLKPPVSEFINMVDLLNHEQAQ